MTRNRMPGHGKDNGERSLLEKFGSTWVIGKAKKWGENMIQLADKNPMQSNAVRGSLIGVAGIVAMALIQIFRLKIEALGVDPGLINTALNLLEIVTGTGGAVAVIGVRQAQGRVIASRQGPTEPKQ